MQLKTVQERQRVYVFETPQKNAIGSLVASYRPALANWIREAETSRRRIKQVRLSEVRLAKITQ